MAKRTTLFLVMIFFVFVALMTACSDMFEGSDENMRQWFEWGTGLTLPPSAKYIAGKNNTAWLSDIYLKLQVSPTYKKTLDDALTRMTDAPSLPLPDNMKPWPAWDLEGKTLIFYEKRTGSVDDGGFMSHLAFEEATGIIYCTFAEYAP